MTTREWVWMKAYESWVRDGSCPTFEVLAESADACLKAFDERFPQPVPTPPLTEFRTDF